MPAPPVSRLILLLSGSGLSRRVPGRLPFPVSLGAYTGDVIQLVHPSARSILSISL